MGKAEISWEMGGIGTQIYISTSIFSVLKYIVKQTLAIQDEISLIFLIIEEAIDENRLTL